MSALFTPTLCWQFALGIIFIITCSVGPLLTHNLKTLLFIFATQQLWLARDRCLICMTWLVNRSFQVRRRWAAGIQFPAAWLLCLLYSPKAPWFPSPVSQFFLQSDALVLASLFQVHPNVPLPSWAISFASLTWVLVLPLFKAKDNIPSIDWFLNWYIL